MGRGGYRPGAGRKPGKTQARAIGRSLATRASENLPDEIRVKINLGAKEKGMTPLEFMLAIMRDEEQPLRNRVAMAVAAAPYVHPKASDLVKGKKEQQAAAAANAGQGSEWGEDLEASAPN